MVEQQQRGNRPPSNRPSGGGGGQGGGQNRGSHGSGGQNRGGGGGGNRGGQGGGGGGSNRGGRGRRSNRNRGRGGQGGQGQGQQGGGQNRQRPQQNRPPVEKEEPFVPRPLLRYGVLFYDTFAQAKADKENLIAKKAEFDQLNIVIKAEGDQQDAELAQYGKLFAGAAWTLIHTRRVDEGWYNEPR